MCDVVLALRDDSLELGVDSDVFELPAIPDGFHVFGTLNVNNNLPSSYSFCILIFVDESIVDDFL